MNFFQELFSIEYLDVGVIYRQNEIFIQHYLKH